MDLSFTQKMLVVYWRELSVLAKKARLAKKLSIRNLARLAKIYPASLCRFEAQKRSMSPENLERLADYLNIQINALGRLELELELDKKRLATCPKCLFRFRHDYR